MSDIPYHDLDTLLALLRSGYFPSNEEKASILSSIREHKSALQEVLNYGINRLLPNSTMETYDRHRATLERLINYQAGLLAPIRQLPDEILEVIFLQAAQHRVRVYNPVSEEWRLEKVCKRWRDIILSLQQLWAHIDGDAFTFWSGKHPKAVERAVICCLQRSGCLPLSIGLCRDWGHSENFIPLMACCSSRWQEITIKSINALALPFIDSALPNLQSLILFGEELKGFQNAEQLSRVTLIGSCPFRRVELPWSQLKYLRLERCGYRAGALTDVLRRTPKLVEFVYVWGSRFWTHPELETPPSPIWPLLNLTLLDIATSDWRILEEIPVVSSLTTLRLARRHSDSPNTMYSDLFADFVNRTQCLLTSICFSHFDATTVSKILEATPSVTFVELENIPQVIMVLDELRQSPFCPPSLEVLSLKDNFDDVALVVQAVISLIEVRSEEAHTRVLRKVDLSVKNIYPLFDKEASNDAKRLEIRDLLQPLMKKKAVSITIQVHPT